MGRLKEVTADRGVESAEPNIFAHDACIEFHMCPKLPTELESRLEEKSFLSNLRRVGHKPRADSDVVGRMGTQFVACCAKEVERVGARSGTSI